MGALEAAIQRAGQWRIGHEDEVVLANLSIQLVDRFGPLDGHGFDPLLPAAIKAYPSMDWAPSPVAESGSKPEQLLVYSPSLTSMGGTVLGPAGRGARGRAGHPRVGRRG